MPFLRRLARRWMAEPWIPALLLMVAGSVWAFLEITDEVMERESHAFDERILLAMREPGNPAEPLGPYWLEEMGRDLTALGGFTVLTGLTVSVAGFLLIIGRRKMAWLSMASITGGILLTTLLKRGFDRPRPELVPHGVVVTNASFPSGHAMMSAVVYLTLGVMLAGALPGVRLKIYVISLSVLATLCVGVSRVYLGVHWPTDVLAGWTLGAAWALLCHLAVTRWRRMG